MIDWARAFLTLGIAVSVGCGGDAAEGAATPDVRERQLLFHHGLEVGDRIAPRRLDCSDGERRTLGDPAALQIVTFSTTSDCSACDRHMHGVEQLFRQGRLPGEQFVVTYAPPSRRAEVLAALQASTMRPICFDEQGMLWTRHDLSHTPVTAFVRAGRVVHLDDAPMETERDMAEFRHVVLSRAAPER